MRQVVLAAIASLLLSVGTTLAQVPASALAATESGDDCPPPELKPKRNSLNDPGTLNKGSYAPEADDTHVMVGVEFLYWRLQPMRDVPLFTTGGGGNDGNGTLGQASTLVLSNNFDSDNGYQAGYRLRFGIATEGQNHAIGLEGSYFNLNRFDTNAAFGGIAVLSRPVVDARDGTETILSVISRDQFAGSATLRTASRLWGADVNAILWPDGYYYSPLAGISYYNLREDLVINQNSTLLAGGLTGFNGAQVNPPAAISITDSFQTRNEFYGAHVGVKIDNTYFDPLFLQFHAKTSLGATRQQVITAGSTTLAGIATSTGGALALASNIGTSTRSHFAVVPEVGLNVGFEMGCVRIHGGYSFLYWSNVVRPSTEIDRTINPQLLPTSVAFGGAANGILRPAPQFRQESLFVHGANVGIEISY